MFEKAKRKDCCKDARPENGGKYECPTTTLRISGAGNENIVRNEMKYGEDAVVQVRPWRSLLPIHSPTRPSPRTRMISET
jgi:hypothetical protein